MLLIPINIHVLYFWFSSVQNKPTTMIVGITFVAI